MPSRRSIILAKLNFLQREMPADFALIVAEFAPLDECSHHHERLMFVEINQKQTQDDGYERRVFDVMLLVEHPEYPFCCL